MKQMIVLNFKFEEGNRVSKHIDIVETDGSIKDLYKHLECDMFDVARMPLGDYWVDDNGLITSDNVVCDYGDEENPRPLAGNIVVTKGVDEDGETIYFNPMDVIEDVSTMIDIITHLESAPLVGVTR